MLKPSTRIRNYLRVRGEYTHYRVFVYLPAELPPRARRIHHHALVIPLQAGTTSACAENTQPGPAKQGVARNYLRVRGEYRDRRHAIEDIAELPPRARRILFEPFGGFLDPGTTSACAENTYHPWGAKNHDRNYLRVRGEYTTRLWDLPASVELPPRTRRIRDCLNPHRLRGGTTSAYAENTARGGLAFAKGGNYLRVRGEYANLGLTGSFTGELPPRTRRIPPKPHTGR